MKRTVKAAVAAICGAGIALTSIGCDNGTTNKKAETDPARAVYEELGRRHNEILSDFYFGEKAQRSVEETGSGLTVEDYFGEVEEIIVRRISDGDILISGEMLEKNLISEEAAPFISRIEAVIAEVEYTIAETQEKITRIEDEAALALEEDKLGEVLSYAETAKASLEFWDENYGRFFSEENLNSRAAMSKEEKRHRAAMSAASDAAGAAAGFVLGMVVSGGNLPTAIAVSVASAAASSAQGYQENCICVICIALK